MIIEFPDELIHPFRRREKRESGGWKQWKTMSLKKVNVK